MIAINLNYVKPLIRFIAIITVGYLLLTLSRPINVPSVLQTTKDTVIINPPVH